MYDKYSMLLVDIYYQVYGAERSTQIWDAVYNYYSQEVAYLHQYLSTKKADGVRANLNEAVQILYGLEQFAADPSVLNDHARANQVSDLLNSYGYQIN